MQNNTKPKMLKASSPLLESGEKTTPPPIPAALTRLPLGSAPVIENNHSKPLLAIVAITLLLAARHPDEQSIRTTDTSTTKAATAQEGA